VRHVGNLTRIMTMTHRQQNINKTLPAFT